jgi:Tol biopolymer transport system component
MRAVFMVFLMATVTIQAQEVREVRTKRIKLPDNDISFVSAVSPDGNKILVSGPNYKGIYITGRRGGRVTRISDAPGAGYEPRFSEDGRYIFFREDEFPDKKKVSSLIQYDMTTGNRKVVADRVPDLAAPEFSGNRMHYRSGGRMNTVNLDNVSLKGTGPDIFVISEELTPVVYINGEGKQVKPNGDGSYIWASLSPDRSRLLYYFAGKGTFVSDLDGKILFSPGKISAPRWLNDQIIIGMEDHDDGYRVTGSEIVCFSLSSGRSISLTSTPERAEMYPLPLPDGKNVVFQTPEGEIFIMRLKVK